MSIEAIILAGGLGTRLRSVVNDLPKCMAPVAGKPFLQYVMDYLQSQGVGHFILSVGYKHQAITDWVLTKYKHAHVQFSVEAEPLGTGGAIQLACRASKANNLLVLNGDTLFKTDINALLQFHHNKNADCSLCLKPMQNFDRYGAVETDDTDRVTNFREKKHYDKGYINGGVYLLNREAFMDKELPEKFSFEKDYLEACVQEGRFFGLQQDAYFIDIGIPEDWKKAQADLGL